MISTNQPTHNAITQGQAVVRALSSITSEQASTIGGIVQASGRVWDVQAVDDYDGYLSILIEPIVICDEQKAFFISGTAQRLELFEAHDDNLAPIGTFTDSKALGARLTRLLDVARRSR